jgi:hypothetical protein
MLNSQRPRTQSVVIAKSGIGGQLRGLMRGPGKVVVLTAAGLALVGGALLMWGRGRERAALQAQGVEGGVPGTEQTFLPAGVVASSTTTPLSAPVKVEPARPMELSMVGPRGTVGGAGLPLDALTDGTGGMAPLGQPLDGPSATVGQGGPGVTDPLKVMPGGGMTGSPATASLPDTLTATPKPPPAPGSGGMVTAPSNPAASGEVKALLDEATGLVQRNQLVAARKKLNDALFDARFSSADRGAIRTQLASVNETLFWSPTIAAGDMIADSYTVQPGDSLARIVRRQGLPIDWRLLQRINRMSSPNALRAGQRLKVIRLPIHAVVHKDAYRMDLYAGSPPSGSGASDVGPDGQERGWVYIRSFRVGLGESNGTPEGLFVVRANSKLVNPRWVNPRTGEIYEADDPNNPIGEHWIGLDGADENTRQFTGYGIHGTIDRPSIGQQRSMGCVRLVAEDVEIVYELLVDRLSTVKIIK